MPTQSGLTQLILLAVSEELERHRHHLDHTEGLRSVRVLVTLEKKAPRVKLSAEFENVVDTGPRMLYSQD